MGRRLAIHYVSTLLILSYSVYFAVCYRYDIRFHIITDNGDYAEYNPLLLIIPTAFFGYRYFMYYQDAFWASSIFSLFYLFNQFSYYRDHPTTPFCLIPTEKPEFVFAVEISFKVISALLLPLSIYNRQLYRRDI